MERRQFFERTGKGVLGLAIVRAAAIGSVAFLAIGCKITLADVLTWVNDGAGGISTIIGLLVSAGVLACATCSVIANAAVAAIAAIGTAIQAYENAPASGKATLLGKIQTAIQAAITAATEFFKSVAIPGGTLADTILSLAGLILSALTGYLQDFFPTALGTVRSFHLGSNAAVSSPVAISVTPKSMSLRQYNAAWNAIVKQAGYPEAVRH